MGGLVGFVILHYQNIEVTDICVQSIKKMEKEEENYIVIVDNDVHKEKAERERLRQAYEDVDNIYILQMTEDQGFSYANNKGYQYAKMLGADYIVVCNNDIEFQQVDFIKRIKAIYEEKRYGVLGPDVLHRLTGEHQNPIDRRLRTAEEAMKTIRMNEVALRHYSLLYPGLMIWGKWSERLRQRNKETQRTFYETQQKGIVLFGACFIFSPLFVTKESRAFTPETRFYYEEYILAYRCKKEGYTMLYDPSVKVLHETGAATKNTFQEKKKRLKFIMEQTMNSCTIYLDLIQRD